MIDLLIRGARVLTPSGEVAANVGCHQGKIVSISDQEVAATKVIDAKGLHLLPGLIDTQVHFRQPGMEHKETIEAGTRGAVLGGITGVFEMPNTNPLTLYKEDLEAKMAIAQQDAWCNYAFYIGGSAANMAQLSALEKLPGCAGIKVFMGSSFGELLAEEDELLLNILKQGERRVAIHAEDEAMLRSRKHIAEDSADVCTHPEWRSAETALTATRRIVNLARKANRKLHLLHISTGDELAFLAQHKDLITVEALPQHLVLHAPECYQRLGSYAQMNPPIRDKSHQLALWQGIQNGVIDVMGSDHAPHTREEKERTYPQSPSGMVGVQTTAPVMLNQVNQGKLSLLRLVDLLSAGPARIFGLAGKGRVAVGYDADFTLVDLNKVKQVDNSEIASVSGWSPFDGVELKGWPVMTIIAGQMVMHSGEVLGKPSGQPFNFLN